MYLLVDLFNSLGLIGLKALIPLGELLVIILLALLLKAYHVLINVDTEDSFSMHLSIIGDVLLTIHGISGEPVSAMGNIDSSVASTLHGTEDLVTGGGIDQSDIKDGLEGPPIGIRIFTYTEVFTINGSLARVDGVHLELL